MVQCKSIKINFLTTDGEKEYSDGEFLDTVIEKKELIEIWEK
ncbi:DUF1572 family protein [Bacillus cereus]|nr:DUF1572 family protein [Bacillus cereus]MDM5235120.1 DUF1572 family protein [Bacillus cereus]